MAKKGLLGSGSSGRQRGNIKGAPATINTAGLDHSKNADPATAAARYNVAAQGKMEQEQLKKNKSAGIKP